jgi:hypothetical protein
VAEFSCRDSVEDEEASELRIASEHGQDAESTPRRHGVPTTKLSSYLAGLINRASAISISTRIDSSTILDGGSQVIAPVVRVLPVAHPCDASRRRSKHVPACTLTACSHQHWPVTKVIAQNLDHISLDNTRQPKRVRCRETHHTSRLCLPSITQRKICGVSAWTSQHGMSHRCLKPQHPAIPSRLLCSRLKWLMG